MGTPPDGDTVDLRYVGSALKRGRWWILGAALLGVGLAGAVTRTLAPEYEANATVLLRTQASGSLPSIGSIVGLGGLGGASSELETELGILTSRSLAGATVDSLRLQLRVIRPFATRSERMFSSVRLPAELTEGEYRFQRAEGGWTVEGPAGPLQAAPGRPARIGGAVLTLRSGGLLPDEFVVLLSDREDAIGWLRENLQLQEPQGELVEMAFSAGDPRTAAEVPNLIAATYLAGRRTTDRSANQYRYEFLTQHTDSLARELRRAEGELRQAQEQSGIADLEAGGRAELERAGELQTELEQVEFEANALQRLLAQTTSGSLSVRDLAAFPTFLRNAAINGLLGQLIRADADRQALLTRRQERNQEVAILDSTVQVLERNLVQVSRAYSATLQDQRESLRVQLERYRALLAAQPAQVERYLRLQREVKRLSETYTGLQTQLVQARLASIAEGGDVRLVDPAVPPKHASFPVLPLNLAIGLLGGLLLGAVGALGRWYLGSGVRDANESEFATGLPTISLSADEPLLVGGLREPASVLVIPVGSAPAELAANRIATTAGAQGRRAVMASWVHANGPEPEPVPVAGTLPAVPRTDVALVPDSRNAGYLVYSGGRNGSTPAAARDAVAELESRFELVIVALPPLDQPPTLALIVPPRSAVLVARAGKVRRSELREAVATLRRLNVQPLGVVLELRRARRATSS